MSRAAMSDETYDKRSTLVLEALAKYPQGMTSKAAAMHLKVKQPVINHTLRRMLDDCILVKQTRSNPVRGAHPRRWVTYHLAPPGTVASRRPGPELPRAGLRRTPAPPAEAPAPTERSILLKRGAELLASPARAALVGPHPDVELVLLRVAIYHLENS